MEQMQASLQIDDPFGGMADFEIPPDLCWRSWPGDRVNGHRIQLRNM